MIASYVLFPFVSVASGLMPEFSSEMAGVVTGETIPRAIPGLINIKSISNFFIVYSCPTYKKN
jgi:hypothetical protein